MADLQAGIAGLNRASPQTPAEQHRIFAMKKQLVDELVAEAMIDANRDIRVEFRAKIMDQELRKNHWIFRMVVKLQFGCSYQFLMKRITP